MQLKVGNYETDIGNYRRIVDEKNKTHLAEEEIRKLKEEEIIKLKDSLKNSE